MKQMRFFVCPVCGNLSFCTGGAAVSCCGRPLEPLAAKKAGPEEALRVTESDGDWYVESGRQEFRVSEQVQIHLTGADLWLEGTEGLERILADGYTLTLYYDRPASEGGQIRIITAQ